MNIYIISGQKKEFSKYDLQKKCDISDQKKKVVVCQTSQNSKANDTLEQFSIH